MIVDARVTFEDDPQRWKRRPVVVLTVQASCVTVLPCTSAIKQGPSRLTIRGWRSAGLLRPTDVCLRTRTVDLADIGAIRGQLRSGDVARLMTMLGLGPTRELA